LPCPLRGHSGADTALHVRAVAFALQSALRLALAASPGRSLVAPVTVRVLNTIQGQVRIGLQGALWPLNTKELPRPGISHLRSFAQRKIEIKDTSHGTVSPCGWITHSPAWPGTEAQSAVVPAGTREFRECLQNGLVRASRSRVEAAACPEASRWALASAEAAHSV
jgi:hypothetical protein